MRLIQDGKHIEKMIIQSYGDEVVQVIVQALCGLWVDTDVLHINPTPLICIVIARQDASYLITGGIGGIERSLLYRLAKNGAKNIVLASRSDLSSASARALVKDIEALDIGITMAVRKCEVGK